MTRPACPVRRRNPDVRLARLWPEWAEIRVFASENRGGKYGNCFGDIGSAGDDDGDHRIVYAAGAGLLFALVFRAELAVPDVQFLGARVYMTLMTLHGMVMVSGFLNAQIAPDSGFILSTFGIPAHLHVMFVGFTERMGIAGIYYLYPYFTGRMYTSGWATGISGCGRSACSYRSPPWGLRDTSVFRAGFPVFMFTIAWSAGWGRKAPADPWPVEMDESDAKAVQPAQ